MSALHTVRLRDGAARIEDAHRFFAAAGLEIVAFDAAQARLAEEGMVRFGKDRRGEPAELNVGDLFAYAPARRLTAPLLSTGRDFTATDVTPARPC